MADISVEKKKGGDLTWVWALVAVLAVGGLMVWLATSQQTTTQVVSGVGTDTVAGAPGAGGVAAEPVDMSALSADPEPFTGRRVQASNVSVAAVLGDRAFWADVPGANPFLVVVGAEVASTDWLTAGATLSRLEGTVQPVSDAELNQWVEGQVIRPEARDEASFASHYLNAVQVTP
jgi:hypothetical protein